MTVQRGLPVPKTDGLRSFIPADEIERLIREHAKPDAARIRDVVAKSLAKQRLDPAELATLLNADGPKHEAAILDAAHELKQRVYGNRIVLFAPLYIGNDCVNECRYCGFRRSNEGVDRATLSLEAIAAEVKALVGCGHKRLILVYGEHPRYDAAFIAETVRHVYAQRVGNGVIRRVNINAAPFDVEGFRAIKAAGIGTYQIFQETYHEPTYAQVHPKGPKANFLWRLHALDRAMEAGIDDVGIGALFGLHDWRFEAMGLLYHTMHLEERFGVGPHTISFPRIWPAVGSDLSEQPPARVGDADFRRLIASLRLAVPYTGLILTCREPVALRNEMIRYGVSQIDAGSNIGVGSYAAGETDTFHKSQFQLGDRRSLDQVIRELCEADLIPSFCTACYRMGRTGQHFMEFAIPGFVKEFCAPNAVLTFQEYLCDYGTTETKEAGARQIERELTRMQQEQRQRLDADLARVRAGERDVFW
jgi:2-iminoacetate synthase